MHGRNYRTKWRFEGGIVDRISGDDYIRDKISITMLRDNINRH